MTTPVSSPICVTGVTGYIASFVVKDLLENGYTVHGTIRKGSDTSAITALTNAETHLHLFEADLLHPSTLPPALKGCTALIHCATPVNVPADGSSPFTTIEEAENEQIRPAVEGTRAILQAAVEAGIKTVVLTSSIAAMTRVAKPYTVIDESCWSDVEYLRSSLLKGATAYALSKTMQELLAWEFAKQNNIRLVTINPALVAGPSITGRLNASLDCFLTLVRGEGWPFSKYKKGTIPDDYGRIVDVRDVARAHVLAMEKGEGRYLLLSHVVHLEDVVRIMREAHPAFAQLPQLTVDSPNHTRNTLPARFSNEKVVNLGVPGQAWEKTISDTAKALAVHLPS